MNYRVYKLFWLLTIIALFAITYPCLAVAPNAVNTLNARINAHNLTTSKKLVTFDVSALNLVKKSDQNSSSFSNTPINITLADFDEISAVGNSWLLFENDGPSFTMNIGKVNSSTPQSWTLPTNFLNLFEGASKSDFISPTNVPSGLDIPSSNKIMVTQYLDFEDNIMDVYDHYILGEDGVFHLGTGYDFLYDDDELYDEEPDYEYADVPLDLGDIIQVEIEQIDYKTGLALNKHEQTHTVDAFGTINTPLGTYECLRISILNNHYRRSNINSPYTLLRTIRYVSFITKDGLYFNGVVSAANGIVNINNYQFRAVVPTATLTNQTDVKLNNNANGVSINTDDSYPDSSAILDIKSVDKGILIPRISRFNRPVSPATGLLIYQIDQNPGFYFYDGTAWKILGSSPSARIAASKSSDISVYSEKDKSSNITGFGKLKSGKAFIKFDTAVQSPENLIISLQLEDNANGLYVSKKTKEGFEVREIKRGRSNSRFSFSVEHKK
jgi:hypothetical protein